MNESKNLRNKTIITNVTRYIKIITDTNTNGKEKKSEVNKSLELLIEPFLNRTEIYELGLVDSSFRRKS